jgi:hypothetical protein
MKIDRLTDVQFNHFLEVLIQYKKCNPEKDVYLSEKSIQEAIQFFIKTGLFEDLNPSQETIDPIE